MTTRGKLVTFYPSDREGVRLLCFVSAHYRDDRSTNANEPDERYDVSWEDDGNLNESALEAYEAEVIQLAYPGAFT